MNRNVRLTTFPTDPNWVQGYVREKKFYAKLFDEPSCYGIEEGRVSKLYIVGKASYDWNGFFEQISSEYEDYNFFSCSEAWYEYENEPYICKFKGENGDIIIGWKGVHDK